MMRQLFRLPPQLPVHAMKTYGIVAPLETHWRDADCSDADCDAYQRGWQTIVDTGTELGQSQAHYIRKLSGRGFSEEPGEAPGLVAFIFPPGQRCFRSPHRVRTGRPELFVVQGGDWRGNPRQVPTIVHKGSDDWVDDFANHQIKLADRLEKG